MNPVWRIEGHAIISDDGMIADASGVMPPGLKNDADWRYFQEHLDRAAIVITGRKGHQAHPNKSGRKRLVFTTEAGEVGFERQGDVALFDPSRRDFFETCAAVSTGGGLIAVTGGTAVFDWFAERRLFTAFHLVRARGVLLPRGKPLFSGSVPPEAHLRSLGLKPGDPMPLDAAARVDLQIFSNSATLP